MSNLLAYIQLVNMTLPNTFYLVQMIILLGYGTKKPAYHHELPPVLHLGIVAAHHWCILVSEQKLVGDRFWSYLFNNGGGFAVHACHCRDHSRQMG